MNGTSPSMLEGKNLAEVTTLMLENSQLAHDPYSLRLYIQLISEAFRADFVSQGFEIVENIPVTTRVDPTTDFVGSGISLVKQQLLEGAIGSGLVIGGQTAIRTHTLNNISLNTPTYRKTTFPCLCAIDGSNSLNRLSVITMEFFRSTLNVPLSKICIRINDEDLDLKAAMNKFLSSIDGYEQQCRVEFDTRQKSYYRHTYGMSNDAGGLPLGGGPILGRNYNICIFNHTHNLFGEVGNIIVMENNEKIRGNEAGFGASTIAAHVLSKLHTTDTHYLATEIIGANKRHHWMRDCIETSIALIHEGLNPARTGGRGVKLSDYIRYIRGLSKKLSINLKDLEGILQRTCDFEYANPDETSRIVDIIMSHLNKTEELSRSNVLNQRYYLHTT